MAWNPRREKIPKVVKKGPRDLIRKLIVKEPCMRVTQTSTPVWLRPGRHARGLAWLHCGGRFAFLKCIVNLVEPL
ncbi:hypothetical protein TELCIR_18187 [Teladorsagia circumcincta]|uniref:Uncharacterized protein n=1 Tax=Teladorsagia circumcincta TaxID=45464 RepID=A0A2G9TQP4_TELCI|nr:hypothetical protein TELCIR_18187 [Teladorsagia circumcincta]